MSFDRVIALIDMDCFYVQCEQRLAPEFWSHPCAVAQYNSWKGGGLIAVNYEARSHRVKRGMRGNDALAYCPDLHIFSVPEVRGKAELSRYREASAQVFEAIKQFVNDMNPNIIVEKASIDEAFIDLTKHIDQMVDRSDPLPEADDLTDTKLELNAENDLNEWLNGLKANGFAINANEIRLALGAVVVQQIRREISDKTEFKCSAGISHNKMLAKLSCALNKPNAQTLLPRAGVQQLFRRIDINKVRSLGGKLGAQVKQLYGINTMFDLKCIELNRLAIHLDIKTAKWLKELADGVDEEPVSNRQVSKSLGCGKNFPGKTALTTTEDIKYWVKQLCEELVERMTRDRETNKRVPKLMTVGFSRKAAKDHNSRSLPLTQWSDTNRLAEQVMKEVFLRTKMEPIVNLSISASKFVDECDDPSNNTIKLENYFKKVNKNELFLNNENTGNCSTSSKKFKPNQSTHTTHTKTLNDYFNSNTSKTNNNFDSNDIEIIETIICNKVTKNISNNTSNVNNTGTTSGVSNGKAASKPIAEEKPIKRGFFFRKQLELRAQERQFKK